MNNRRTLALIHGAAEDAKYNSQYYQSHKDWKKAYNAKYYQEHKDYWVNYYKNAGVKGKIDLERMASESNPIYRERLAEQAKKRGDTEEYKKQLQRAQLERDVKNMYNAVADGVEGYYQQQAVRSAKSGQAVSGASVPFSGKKDRVLNYYTDPQTGTLRAREAIRYSGKGQNPKYAIKDAVNKFGKNWKSGAKDIINFGKKIADKIKWRETKVTNIWSTNVGGQRISGESGFTIRSPRFGEGHTQIVDKWSRQTG